MNTTMLIYSVVLFVFGLNGLLVPQLKKISVVLLVVILGYWFVFLILPVLLMAVFFICFGPIVMALKIFGRK